MSKYLNPVFWVLLGLSFAIAMGDYSKRIWDVFVRGNDSFAAPIIALCIVFSAYMLVRRSLFLRGSRMPSLVSIAACDYSLGRYLTLNILSLIYAICQGVSVALVVHQVSYCWMLHYNNNHGGLHSPELSAIDLALIGAPFIVLIGLRFTLEGYAVLFATAQKIIAYCDYAHNAGEK